MNIEFVKYRDTAEVGWDFDELRLKHVNLFVGATGSGKTRMLNLLFNTARQVITGSFTSPGDTTMLLSDGATKFQWHYTRILDDSGALVLLREEITKMSEDGSKFTLVERDEKTFKYKGAELPRLAKNSSAVSILKEEPEIEPLYRGFSHICRRNFFSDELERAALPMPLSPQLLDAVKKTGSLETMWKIDEPLNIRLFILKEVFPTIFSDICARYMALFPSIEHMDILDLKHFQPTAQLPGTIPVLGIKEKGVRKHIALGEMSSGMQKVLLIITDVLTFPGGVVYMIDEYENSLGINAIDFLPPLLNEAGGDNQFIITTHHPYLINNIPISNWQVFHRTGMKVNIKDGASLEERFGKSKQRAFIQLINDPFYLEGRE